ncbi:hypothetical protein N7422_17845 [Pseudomonas sp. GD04091]|nr:MULTISPECIES: hypothetical protein [unclassified Pseudomonas]MDH0303640.1 hypothetical protein [Pseudomonas sp. GD04091]MDH1987089.1 hypothetical protein [Pseudomonas sp. GD03689]
MISRFVIVPAVPNEHDRQRLGLRYWTPTYSGGFDIYDNKEKQRLTPTYPSREEAETACKKKNLEADCPNGVLPRLQTR